MASNERDTGRKNKDAFLTFFDLKINQKKSKFPKDIISSISIKQHTIITKELKKFSDIFVFINIK